MISLVVASLLAGQAHLRVLFVGNSLVSFNDVPGMVQRLLESDGTGRQATIGFHFSPHLNDAAGDRAVATDVTSGAWDAVVMQGAMVSMSHKFNYSQAQGLSLAKSAVKHGARLLFYSEWSRRGIDETEYTEAIYRSMAKECNARVIPVGRVWDAVLGRFPDLELWQPDGNHAKPIGSYVAAVAVYGFLLGKESRTPSFRIDGASREVEAAALQKTRDLLRG